MRIFLLTSSFVFASLLSVPIGAQTEDTTTGNSPSSGEVVDAAQEKIEQTIGEYAEKVNENPDAKEATQSILRPIYQAAEYLSVPWFHWVAFSLMVAGLISYALQLVLGKLLMLIQFHFSLTEILADGLGFAVSAIGLILTTQAATQNSNFAESPALVLSAAGVGALFGLIFYVRGQTQEFREARELRRRNQERKSTNST